MMFHSRYLTVAEQILTPGVHHHHDRRPSQDQPTSAVPFPPACDAISHDIVAGRTVQQASPSSMFRMNPHRQKSYQMYCRSWKTVLLQQDPSSVIAQTILALCLRRSNTRASSIGEAWKPGTIPLVQDSRLAGSKISACIEAKQGSCQLVINL